MLRVRRVLIAFLFSRSGFNGQTETVIFTAASINRNYNNIEK